ncbi:hypothetical protein MNBD_CHLOROFLEXI01-2415 [hydrothermal vent metagenome]|uniref:Uncharacterized protein n=2 Tax=hydrothermal vent metagenome TaxID=652676 RepID=A0A3B0VIB3_9ZZZZ
MQRKFQYVLMGAGLTLLVIFGALTLLLPPAQASDSSSVLANNSGANANADILADEKTSIAATEDRTITVASDVESDTVPVNWIQSTDPEAVMAVLQQLADRQASELLGQAGWLNITVTGPELHEVDQAALEDYRGPDGQVVPADALYPVGSGVLPRWYYVSKDGLVEQGLVFTSDANNQTYQQTILQGNEWINMTLKEYDFVEDMYTIPATSNQIRNYFSVQEAIQFLEAALLTESSAGEVSVNAYKENGRFHLIVQTAFATPIDLGAPIPEPVTVGERHFVFDGLNGHLLTDTHNFTLQSGEMFLAGIAEYHTSLLLPQLPDNVQQLLNEAEKVLEKENE